MPFDQSPYSEDRHRRRSEQANSISRKRPVDVDMLVVGAGPTGLTAASEAIRHGLSVRIVDWKTHRSTFSKALVAHARTLEIFESMGIVDEVLANGTRFAALNIRIGHPGPATRVDLLDLPWGDTAYPFWLSIPQYDTERILEGHLNRLGTHVEWQVSFVRLQDHDHHVETLLQHGDGSTEVVRARWLIGCDGGRSHVRDQAGISLERSVAGTTFVLADVKTTASLVEDEGHVFLHPDGLLFIVPMPQPHRWRIMAQVRSPTRGAPISIDEQFLDDLIHRRTGIEFDSQDIDWESQFELTHGVADHYRKGRVFIAGDASHVHSPVAGQGLNTGVQDAHNLVWKLAVSRRIGQAAAEALLDSYEAERRAVGQAMVRGVARMTHLLTTRNRVVRQLLGLVAPRAITRPRVQARLGRPVGMLDIAYKDGPLFLTEAIAESAGRRVPNPRLRTGGRLHDRLDGLNPTWLVRQGPRGVPMSLDEPHWCGLPVLFLSDDDLAEEPERGLLDPERVLLVRPDRYVAGAWGTNVPPRDASSLLCRPDMVISH